jgi:hypothetical protein
MNYFAERWNIHDCKKINLCTTVRESYYFKYENSEKRRKFAALYSYMKIKEGLFKCHNLDKKEVHYSISCSQGD